MRWPTLERGSLGPEKEGSKSIASADFRKVLACTLTTGPFLGSIFIAAFFISVRTGDCDFKKVVFRIPRCDKTRCGGSCALQAELSCMRKSGASAQKRPATALIHLPQLPF